MEDTSKSCKLIIEAGATKSVWALAPLNQVAEYGISCKDASAGRIILEGINLALMSEADLVDIVRRAKSRLEGPQINKIDFYCAGLVSSNPLVEKLRCILSEAFAVPEEDVDLASDLVAAARAGLGDRRGIVCILGTGSNCARYDGKDIVENVRPGGFILGDEGSGAALGKAFVADYVKGLLPDVVRTAFEDYLQKNFTEIEGSADDVFARNYAFIVRRVYSSPSPSAFLGSFAPLVLSLCENEYVRALIKGNLENFIKRSLLRVCNPGDEVAVIGGFGCACRKFLLELGREHEINFTNFVPSPIDEILRCAQNDGGRDSSLHSE